MITEANYPITAQPIENDKGNPIGSEVSQVCQDGRKATWTFSTCHIGPNSGHFPPSFVRGPLLIDTDEDTCACPGKGRANRASAASSPSPGQPSGAGSGLNPGGWSEPRGGEAVSNITLSEAIAALKANADHEIFSRRSSTGAD